MDIIMGQDAVILECVDDAWNLDWSKELHCVSKS